MESLFIVVVEDTRRPNRIGLRVELLLVVSVSSSFCGRNVVRAGVNMCGVDNDLLFVSSLVVEDNPSPPLESFVVSYSRKKFRGVILPGVELLLRGAEGEVDSMMGKLDLMARNDDKGDVAVVVEVEDDPSL